ncbi:hypothetical protein CEXT_512051 [Caerostris extrusa]|uniref:Secreted protein n=1 Tax=Caerostris extrusa TaxID=172846 RepID=A0AAV4X8Y3_CAEEX|nr:hypothetical protein CEXT_512051 [Caerostris extrusa]
MAFVSVIIVLSTESYLFLATDKRHLNSGILTTFTCVFVEAKHCCFRRLTLIPVYRHDYQHDNFAVTSLANKPKVTLYALKFKGSTGYPTGSVNHAG